MRNERSDAVEVDLATPPPDPSILCPHASERPTHPGFAQGIRMEYEPCIIVVPGSRPVAIASQVESE